MTVLGLTSMVCGFLLWPVTPVSSAPPATPALREESQSQPQQAEGWKNQGVSLKGIKI